LTSTINYHSARFIMSAAEVRQLPQQPGREVALVGRSNAGKSSALNRLTGQKKLARTSKLPGRTRLINLFQVADQAYLVDLPGYGYAEVPDSVKKIWQQTLTNYLDQRQQLQGVVLLMDCRHPLKVLDQQLIQWAIRRPLPLLILLTKKDKLSHSAYQRQEQSVRRALLAGKGAIEIIGFSALQGCGVEGFQQQLDRWLLNR
jgi:GTP-binding protein